MWRGIGIFIAQTMLRATIGTAAALDTLHPLDRPSFIEFIDGDGISGALFLADAAKDAVVDIIFNMASRDRLPFPRYNRIHFGGRFMEQTLHHRFTQTECRHDFPYLSVQLIQGSMVNTNIGTSAKSQPCKVFTIAGILELVGVRTRIRSRNFESWPLQ